MSENGDLTSDVVSLVAVDVFGDPRALVWPTQSPGGMVDRGADEYFPTETFKRGDANQDNMMNIADAIFLLGFLFGTNPAPDCRDAADFNDDGSLDISDPVYLLSALFGMPPGPVPPAPIFPVCGGDPTVDLMRSCVSPHCP